MPRISITVVGVCLVASAFGQADFRMIPYLPGGNSGSALAVSADGNWVVGISNGFNGLEAFRWSEGTGIQGLGDLPEGLFVSAAYGVSGNGQVVVGIGTRDGYQEAFRWTPGEGMVGLGNLENEPFYTSVANAVSADGQVLAGTSDIFLGSEAFRWTAGNGLEGIGFFPGDVVFHSEAFGVSADGSSIVGLSDIFPGTMAFRWRQSVGMEQVGFLPGGTYSAGYACSSNGAVVVGQAETEDGLCAFRWSSAGGIVAIPDFLPDDDMSSANAISGDGNIIVGEAIDFDGQVAFIKRPALAMERLIDVLTNEYGLNMTGWALTSATGISSDGSVIVGTGTFGGLERGWIVRLPQPGTVSASVELEGYLADPTQQGLLVQLRMPGSTIPLETRTLSVDSSGIVRFVTALRGTFDLAVKGSHWLRSVNSVTVTETGGNGGSFSLTNGDVDGDNEVTIGDYALLSTAFGSAPGDGNWNPEADLDGDQEVTIGDYAQLSANFGANGDD